jgi:hypothetical protein
LGVIEARFAELTTMPMKFQSMDIIENLPVLRKFASNVTSINELGVRSGVASWALAAGVTDRLGQGQPFGAYTAIDITRKPTIDCMERVLKG